jgi:hypothetical protein
MCFQDLIEPKFNEVFLFYFVYSMCILQIKRIVMPSGAEA